MRGETIPKNPAGKPCGFGGKKEKTHPGSAFVDGRWYLNVFDPNAHLRRVSGGEGLPPHQDVWELADACYEDEPWYPDLMAALYPSVDRTPTPQPILEPLAPELVLIEGESATDLTVQTDTEDVAA